MQAQFKEAQQYVQDQQNQGTLPPESVRGRLYGLGKQASEGDCRMVCPPSSNTVLRAKWDAWMACKGTGQDQAISEYLAIVKKAYPQYKGVRASISYSDIPAVLSPTALSANSIIKQGTLFKQRDVFKGWRPRRFVLQDTFLHYYVDIEEFCPHKSIDLSGASLIEVRSTRLGDVEYFPFVISHSKSNKSYNLAASSKQEADEWIVKLREVCSQHHQQVWNSNGAVIDRLMERKVTGSDVDEQGKMQVINSEVTLKDIPSKYQAKVEVAVQTLLSSMETDSGWEPLYDKNGVSAKKRQGDVLTVKAEALLAHNLPDVFEMLISCEKMKIIEPQVHAIKMLKALSSNTMIMYRQAKQVWPAQQRDYCYLFHWRILADHRVVMVTFSEKFDDICPLEENIMRAELILGGYVLKPTINGTIIQYIAQTDMRGTVPMASVNLSIMNQPMVLANLRKHLDAHPHKTSVSKGKFMTKVSYEDLLDKYTRARDKVAAAGSNNGNNNAPVTTTSSNQTASQPSSVQAEDTSPSSSTKVAVPVERVKAAVSNIMQKMVGKAANNAAKRHRKKITAVSLLMLLTPALLYYVAEDRFRVISFLIGLFFTFRYLFRLHHGVPAGNQSVSSDRIFNSADGPRELYRIHRSRMVLRFPVDLGKLLRYLDSKREESGFDISPTHIAIKAVGMTFAEMPRMNGNILFGYFYRSKAPGVDVSVSVDISEKYTAMVKIVDSDVKPLEYIANELQVRSKTIRTHASNVATTISNKSNDNVANENIIEIIKDLVPILRIKIQQCCDFLGSNLGIAIPKLGIIAYPYGVCSIMTCPNRDGSDADIDLAVVPSEGHASAAAAAPILVSIGGIRVLPSFDSDRKLIANPVLNIAVSIDTAIGSLTECRKFCSKLQTYLNNPTLLEKADRKQAVAKEDEKIAQEKQGRRRSMF